MRVVIEPTADRMYRNAGRRIERMIRANPSCVLGLATGRTMAPLYDELARRHGSGGLSLARVVTFNLDEYLGVGRSAAGSFHAFMREHLQERTDLQAASMHLPDGLTEDPFAEAEGYEARIREAGGIDLQVLGLGANGHIGFNEPGSSLRSRTRVKALSEATLAANRDDLPPDPGPPRAAITVGLGTILDARSCLVIAVGEGKARAVAAMVEGPVTARVPASALQFHPEVAVLVDEAAASRLEEGAYYREAERLQREFEHGRGPSELA